MEQLIGLNVEGDVLHLDREWVGELDGGRDLVSESHLLWGYYLQLWGGGGHVHLFRKQLGGPMHRKHHTETNVHLEGGKVHSW